MSTETTGVVNESASDRRGYPVLCAPVVFIAGIWLASTGAHWSVRDFSWIVSLVSLFVAITLAINVAGLLLAFFARRITAEYDLISSSGRRSGDELRRIFGRRAPHGGFSLEYWVSAWARHARDEPGFVDCRSYLFIVMISNGFLSTVPYVFILVMMTWQSIPASVLGLIMSATFYQLLYGTCVHFIAALAAPRETWSDRLPSWVFDLGVNLPWLLFPAAGIAIGVHLTISGSYSAALW